MWRDAIGLHGGGSSLNVRNLDATATVVRGGRLAPGFADWFAQDCSGCTREN
jgi:hypothetical protein